MSTLQPFGWVVNSPKEMEPVEAFTREPQSAEKYRAAGWTVTEVFTTSAFDPLRTQVVETNQAYYRLNEHNNETEQYLDKAAELLGEIAQSGQVYRECTDKSSPAGLRIADVLQYVAQFQPEPPQPSDDEDGQDEEWRMHPCNQGHRDVGAAGGVAHCNQCGESISATTTREAFELWNASHPEQPV